MGWAQDWWGKGRDGKGKGSVGLGVGREFIYLAAVLSTHICVGF